MHTPKTSECLENFGMQVLHIGQWAALKALGMLQALHIIFICYKYGLAYIIFLAIILLSWVLTLPLVLKPTKAYSIMGKEKN